MTKSQLYCLLALAWLLIAGVNAPGQLSIDSIISLYEGRFHDFSSWTPPLVTLLVGLFDSILPGTALYMLAVQALFFGSLFVIVRRAFATNGTFGRRTWLILPLLLFNPLICIYQGIIWKDVLFANLSLAAFAALLPAAMAGAPRRWRWYALALALGALAAQTRYNGLTAPVLVGIAVVVTEASHRPWTRTRTTLAAGGGGLAGLLLAFAVAVPIGLIADAVSITPRTHGKQVGIGIVQEFDIAGMLARGAPVPPTLLPSDLDQAALQTDLTRYYTPERIDPLGQAGTLQLLLNGAGRTPLWTALILSDPGAYLRHRLAAFREMVWPTVLGHCVPVYIGISGVPAQMTALRLAEGVSPGQQGLFNYAKRYFRTGLYDNLLYGLAATVMAALLWRRRLPGDQIMALCLASALAYAVAYLLVGIACDVRYMYALPVAVTAAALQLCRQTRRGMPA